MAEDAFVTDFEHIMADDITENVRFIMYDSESGKTASAGEVSKYMMKNVHVDTTLTEEGAAADAKAVGEALATKADTSGTYEDLIAGGAEQLMADGYETDKDPYLFRPTGGSADVGNREYVDKIVGGTVAWNQLVSASATSVTVQSGHKYIAKIGGAWSVAASSGSAISVTGGSDMLIDLTALFNPTIADYIYSLEQSQAGAGVAWFRNYFPKDYYPYDPGTLRSVEGVSAHEMVGKNKLPVTVANIKSENSGVTWNGNTAIINGVTFTIQTDASGNVMGINVSGTATANIVFFVSSAIDGSITESCTLTGCPSGGSSETYYQTINYFGYDYGRGKTATIGAQSSRKARIDIKSGTTASNLVFKPMLRLASETGSIYEPYQKHTYPLDSSLTLRGVPKLVDGKLAFDGDVYPPSGEVQRRYGVVDLGTLSWTVYGAHSWSAYVPLMKLFTLSGGNVFLSGYKFDYNLNADRTYSLATNSSPQIWIRDDAYTDAASFKAAMSGVYLVYELATPTTETAEGYEQYHICDPSGTEEFVTTGIVPVGHETRYPHDLKKKIETAPDSPSADGTYLMKRSGGKNTYMALPSTPSANGAYVLTVTVSGGSASYSWTAKE